jgi:hypothetical protein
LEDVLGERDDKVVDLVAAERDSVEGAKKGGSRSRANEGDGAVEDVRGYDEGGESACFVATKMRR